MWTWHGAYTPSRQDVDVEINEGLDTNPREHRWVLVDRDPRAVALYRARCGEWVVRYRLTWDQLPGFAPLYVVDPKKARSILRRLGFKVPGYLEREVAAAESPLPTEIPAPEPAPASVEPLTSEGASPPKSGDVATAPKSISEMIEELRHRGKSNRAALVEYMQSRGSATVDEIAEHVHGNNQTSEEAIRQNVKRTNADLAAMVSPLRFSVASGYVHKKTLPD